MPESAQLIRCYWYLIARNPLWLVGLLPGVDPRYMTHRDALSAAANYLRRTYG